MEKTDTLKLSHLFLLQSWVQALLLSLRKLPISQAKRLPEKKPYLVQKFAQRLARKLNEGDIPWIAKDTDLLFSKIDNLPGLILKSPTAKRAFRNWEKTIRDRGPLGLERSLIYYRKVLLALLDSPKITPEEKSTIEAALLFVRKGLRPIVKQISQNFNIEDIWKLPNGKRMLLGSDFDVGPDDSDENKNFTTPWIDHIRDTAPSDSEGIKARDAYNRFDLEHEVQKHPALTRFERQILLLKCKSDITTKEIAKELRKPPKSVSNTYYNARRKMDAWLKRIGMKEVLRNDLLRRDNLMFDPPSHKTVKLPSLWDDYQAKSPSPVKGWFDKDHGQDFLQSLIPPGEEKPWCW